VSAAEKRRPAWLADAFAVSLFVAIVTGVISALYHRPGGPSRWGIGFWFGLNPDRVALTLHLVNLLTWLHRGAVAATVVFGFASRGHVLRFEKKRLRQLFVALTLLIVVATGLLVPWRDSLPWSDPNPHAPVTELSGLEGPFLELTAVRLHYPTTAEISRDRVSFVLGLVHFILPVGLGIALIILRRRQRFPVAAPALEPNRDTHQPAE